MPEQTGRNMYAKWLETGGEPPRNPYLSATKRMLWLRGWDAAHIAHRVALQMADQAKREAEHDERQRQRAARDEAERERLTNRSPQEILYESNLPDDVRDLLIRLVDKVGLE